MPVATESTAQRREAILEILQVEDVLRQSQLVGLLAQRGITATQSSISRDLQQLGIAKLGSGYQQPRSETATRGNQSESRARLVRVDFVREINTAGPNLTVIKTAVGAAQTVAVFLDRASWPEIVGTLSGDDTIFIATQNVSDQRSLVTKLQNHFSD